MEPLRWQLGDVAVAMSLAADGDLREAEARQNWCRRHGIPLPSVVRQVHGVRVATPAHGPPAEADALASADPACALAVFGADCPPLVLAAPDALAVAHCGWRGTAAGIVAATATALARLSAAPPTTWHALVGPGVHPDDYEVDAPVLAGRRWPAGCLAAGRSGRAWLDLPGAVAADCRAAGIAAVARDPRTTSRHPRLRSHRRDGRGPPQLLVAWRPRCAG